MLIKRPTIQCAPITCHRRKLWKSIHDIRSLKVSNTLAQSSIIFEIYVDFSLILFLIWTELLRRVQNGEGESAEELALIMFRTATLRSGFMLQESADFADSVEKLMRQTLGISANEQVEEEDIPAEQGTQTDDDIAQEDSERAEEEHDEL